MLRRLNLNIPSAADIPGLEEFIHGLSWYDSCTILRTGKGYSVDLIIHESRIETLLRAIDDFIGMDSALIPRLLHEDMDRPIDGPVMIDDFFIITPHENPRMSSEIQRNNPPFVLTIRGDRAFGLGTHPSTMGALKAMAYLYKNDTIRGKQVLGCGAGSGILSLAAWKLGADFVLGIDIDQGALIDAEKNRILNRCTDEKVTFAYMSCLDVRLDGYDIILANLVPSVLAKFLKGGKRLSTVGDQTILLISGYKAGNREFVSSVLKSHDLRLIQEWTIHGWLTTLFQRR